MQENPASNIDPVLTERADSKRVLIVDNNASTRRFLSTALAAAGGCEVTIAKDADEALAAVAIESGFDLIVCDLMLPGLNGCLLIKQLRAEGQRAPILILSSQQDELSLTQALDVGADDYLQKPVDLEELRRSLAVLLARSAERVHGRDKHVPLQGGAVAVRTFEEGSFIELTAPNDSAQIESFQRLAERLVSSRMTPTDRVNLRLALEEMIQNAKEWGNHFDASKKVRLAYCLMEDRVLFRIEDEGAGFEPCSVPDPSIDPRAHIKNRMSSGKRIGGWGMFMTRKLMDAVVYNSAGNVVTITKKFRNASGDSMEIDSANDQTNSECDAGESKAPTSKTRRYTSGEMPWTK